MSWAKSTGSNPSIIALSNLFYRLENTREQLPASSDVLVPELIEQDERMLHQLCQSLTLELRRVCTLQHLWSTTDH